MRVTIAAYLATALLAPMVASAKVQVQASVGGAKYHSLAVTGGTGLRYDVVFVGDGFTTAQQTDFDAQTVIAMNAILARPPYAARKNAFNFWRVNVLSSESGADHPKERTSVKTELDCTFGDGKSDAERAVSCSVPKVKEAASYAPAADLVVVIVNDRLYGGLAWDNVFTVTVDPALPQVATHELGHKFGLADEYDCRKCDGSDSNTTYSGGEPGSPNLTSGATREALKWSSMVQATTPVPTTVDVPTGVVGGWAGGEYAAKGIYHPQHDCHMRTLESGFCSVCANALERELDKHLTRCERAELHPGLIRRPCLETAIVSLLDTSSINWALTRRIRWPIPTPCLQCEPGRPFGPEHYELALTGLPEGIVITAHDEDDNVIGRAVAGGGAARLTFEALPGRRTFVEVGDDDRGSDPSPEPRARSTVRAQLTRDGVRQSLPSGID